MASKVWPKAPTHEALGRFHGVRGVASGAFASRQNAALGYLSRGSLQRVWRAASAAFQSQQTVLLAFSRGLAKCSASIPDTCCVGSYTRHAWGPQKRETLLWLIFCEEAWPHTCCMELQETCTRLCGALEGLEGQHPVPTGVVQHLLLAIFPEQARPKARPALLKRAAWSHRRHARGLGSVWTVWRAGWRQAVGVDAMDCHGIKCLESRRQVKTKVPHQRLSQAPPALALAGSVENHSDEYWQAMAHHHKFITNRCYKHQNMGWFMFVLPAL